MAAHVNSRRTGRRREERSPGSCFLLINWGMINRRRWGWLLREEE